jgi:hypothetical protein
MGSTIKGSTFRGATLRRVGLPTTSSQILGGVLVDGEPYSGWLLESGFVRTAALVNVRQDVRLIGARTAEHLRVPFGAADDDQQRKIGASLACHRAPSMASPPAAWTEVLNPRRADGPTNEETGRGE